jgi:hypothetical protein
MGNRQLRHRPPGESICAFIATAVHLGFEEYDIASQIAFPSLLGDGRAD